MVNSNGILVLPVGTSTVMSVGATVDFGDGSNVPASESFIRGGSVAVTRQAHMHQAATCSCHITGT